MFSRAVLLLFLGGLAAAQSPEFVVATLKLSPPPEGDLININLGTTLHGKVTLSNATLSDCIKFAYGLSADAQLAGPDWIRTGPRFDIVGQAPPGTPRERLLMMTQKLLADRLRLRVRREDRELKYLALIRTGDSAKLKQVAEDTPVSGPVIPGRIVSARMDMGALAKVISRFERETVINQTGLEGFYEVHLEYAPEPRRSPLPGGDAAGRISQPERPAGPSLFSAIEEQLGLKLERRKGPAPVLVVDSADKAPAEN